MSNMRKQATLVVLLSLLLSVQATYAEEIRIATYNIENWRTRFDTRALLEWAKTQPKSEQLDLLIRTERNQDDEDNWEIGETIKKVDADILLFQEGCAQDDLDYFNKRWLGGMYATAKVLPSNTDRDQHIGILLKPGFEIVETKADYHKEIDTVAKDWLKEDDGEEAGVMVKENRLFARGPAFVKVKSPGGYVFWVGTNHQKSKSGNNADVAAWRLRESKRTHEIIRELAQDGTDVVFGGDMNDEIGIQQFEQEAGGDAIAAIVGEDKSVILATQPLVDRNIISFGGYMRDRYRSLIDHIFVSASLKDRMTNVSVYQEGLAAAASDHYPVVLTIKSKE
jgi:hypothetical protein